MQRSQKSMDVARVEIALYAMDDGDESGHRPAFCCCEFVDRHGATSHLADLSAFDEALVQLCSSKAGEGPELIEQLRIVCLDCDGAISRDALLRDALLRDALLRAARLCERTRCVWSGARRVSCAPLLSSRPDPPAHVGRSSSPWHSRRSPDSAAAARCCPREPERRARARAERVHAAGARRLAPSLRLAAPKRLLPQLECVLARVLAHSVHSTRVR